MTSLDIRLATPTNADIHKAYAVQYAFDTAIYNFCLMMTWEREKLTVFVSGLGEPKARLEAYSRALEAVTRLKDEEIEARR